MCLFPREDVVLSADLCGRCLLELANLPHVVFTTPRSRELINIGQLFHQFPKLLYFLFKVFLLFLQIPVLLLQLFESFFEVQSNPFIILFENTELA